MYVVSAVYRHALMNFIPKVCGTFVFLNCTNATTVKLKDFNRVKIFVTFCKVGYDQRWLVVI